jgi:hypothetical protein
MSAVTKRFRRFLVVDERHDHIRCTIVVISAVTKHFQRFLVVDEHHDHFRASPVSTLVRFRTT